MKGFHKTERVILFLLLRHWIQNQSTSPFYDCQSKCFQAWHLYGWPHFNEDNPLLRELTLLCVVYHSLKVSCLSMMKEVLIKVLHRYVPWLNWSNFMFQTNQLSWQYLDEKFILKAQFLSQLFLIYLMIKVSFYHRFSLHISF